MCRSAEQGGRRCPAHSDPQRRVAMVLRQRISRYARAADAAQDRGDVIALNRADRLFQKALDEATPNPPALPVLPPTRAGEFTLETTFALTDDDLAAAWSDCDRAGDLQACQAIEQVMDWRDSNDRARDAEIARFAAEQEQEAEERGGWATEGGVLERPSVRPARSLTVDEQVREDYETYVECSYLEAEAHCNGVLLNKRGRAKGISARSLFYGSPTVARAYASEELRGWWQRNGRLTLGAFRHHALNRASDRAAAHSREDWADAAAV